jgi:hypothetical protein
MIKNNIYTSLKVYVVFVYCILSQQEQSNTIPFLYKGGINGPKFRFQNITDPPPRRIQHGRVPLKKLTLAGETSGLGGSVIDIEYQTGHKDKFAKAHVTSPLF